MAASPGESPDWSAVEPYLDHALDLEPQAREQWLAELASNHPDIASAVRQMLAERDALDAKGFLTQKLDAATRVISRAGERVGAYTIESLIGRGGMGEVWLARRSDGRFEGRCAIKFIGASIAASSLADRFRREGHLLARLTHPNIARLMDAGAAADGSPYLALEYIEGSRIDQYCGEKQLSVRERVHLFLAVVAAVAHAHSQLIIHRDLKPSNVLVTAEGEVKLLDFGIAKLLAADSTNDTATRLEDAALTPEYAAPEQLLGELPSTATDVYQLGLLLYVLLTGTHPLARSDTRGERIRAALDGAIPPASQLATGATRRLLQGDLDAILSMAVRRVPAERYATAQAFRDELLRYLNHEPVAARRGAAWYRVRKFIARHRVGVTAGTVAGAALIAATVGIAVSARRAALERDHAVRELTFAEASNEFMTFLLSEGADKPFTTAELLDRAAQSVDKQFATDADLRARLQLVIGTQYVQLREFAKGEAVLLRAQQSAREVADRSLSVQIDCQLASSYDAVGKSTEAKTLYAELERRMLTTPGLDSSAAAACYNLLAIYYRDKGDAPHALESASAAVAHLGTPRPGQRSMANDNRQLLADAYAMSGRRAEAVSTYEQALRELASMGRENTGSTLATSINYGVHLARAGQTLRAANVYRGLLESPALRGRISNRYLEANYAATLVWLGRYEEAAPMLERARAAAEAAGNKRAIANAHLVGAHLYCISGDRSRCASELASARETVTPLFPPNNRNIALLEQAAARAALAEQDAVAARERLLKSVAIYEGGTEKDNSRIRSLALLSRTELQLGDRPAALAHAQRAVIAARDISKGFPHTEWLGIALLAQAAVQKDAGAKDAAVTALREAYVQLEGSMGSDARATREARAWLAELGSPL